MTEPTKASLSYKEAGVDIKKASALVNDIKTIAKKTHRPGVISPIGGFGALFEIPTDRFQQPVLVSSTDGVGTKLKLAIEMNQHDTIGIDLVAMCVNDLVTLGAEPLFFLDYFATGKLDTQHANAILAGIGKGCELSGSALIGGETAEMPGMYHGDDYDLAGFSVGAVEKANIIDGRDVRDKDTLIALASSGPHANGYSLIRHILQHGSHALDDAFEDSTLGATLLTPTRIYVKTLLNLIADIKIHAIAHITGGGLIENLPRVLPDYTKAIIDTKSWIWPSIFQWLQRHGNVSLHNLYETFNLGIGMVLVVPHHERDRTLERLHLLGETAWVLGSIAASTDKTPTLNLDA